MVRVNQVSKLILFGVLIFGLSAIAVAQHRGGGSVGGGGRMGGSIGGGARTGGGIQRGGIHSGAGGGSSIGDRGHVDRSRPSNPPAGRVDNRGWSRTGDVRGNRDGHIEGRDHASINEGHRERHREVRRDEHRDVRRDGRRDVDRSHYHPGYWGRHPVYIYAHHYRIHPWFWSIYWSPFPIIWNYSWDWYTAPWYAPWAWYYRPYPNYAAASYWITDYVVSETLREAYDSGYQNGYANGAAAGDNSSNGTAVTDSDKDQLRQQVDETVKAFQSEKSIELAEALQKPNFLFPVSTGLSVTTSTGTTCKLSGGDLLKVVRQPADSDPAVSMAVVTSKAGSCTAGSIVNISVQDLQEMLNAFAAKVDSGMDEFQKHKKELKKK